MAIDDAMVERFLNALFGLLPKGLVWVRRGGNGSDRGVRERVLLGIATENAKVSDRAAQLLLESDPRTTSEMISDWEEALGLPETPELDPTLQPSLDARRAAAAQKFAAVGGASVQDMINAAAAVGFTVTIDEYSSGRAPAGMGSHLRDRLWTSGWSFYWLVIAPITTIRMARLGDRLGDRMANWSNAALENAIRRAKPAWTAVGFSYTA